MAIPKITTRRAGSCKNKGKSNFNNKKSKQKTITALKLQNVQLRRALAENAKALRNPFTPDILNPILKRQRVQLRAALRENATALFK